MLGSSDEVQAESFHIFQDDKFTPRRITSKLAVDMHYSAQECYKAEACATVPFIWESQPGTPKHRLCQTPLPPLTPPPSFFTKSAAMPPSKNTSTMVQTRKFLYPRFSFIKSHRDVRLSTSSEASLMSLSSSPSPTVHSSPVTPLCDYYYSRRYGFKFEEENNYLQSSSAYSCSPFICFSSEKGNRQNNARRSRGCCSSMFKRLIGISTI